MRTRDLRQLVVRAQSYILIDLDATAPDASDDELDQIDTLIRFSTVAGERGTPDTWRDPRGFALKLHTSEGNLDIVGNNVPIFFSRDPLSFQHFIRSQKRRKANNLRDNDMQWDFWTLKPMRAGLSKRAASAARAGIATPLWWRATTQLSTPDGAVSRCFRRV